MIAIPVTADAAAPAAAVRFRSELADLERRCAELWGATPGLPPRLGERVTRRRQLANAGAARRLIDRLAGEVERLPAAEAERAAWRRGVERRVRAFGEDRLGWPSGYRRLLFADAYFDSSVEFSRRARAFNPGLESWEIGQALRNVWIMNSLQMLFDRPVELTSSMFAYSMLYPETDNYLDDPAVAASAKRRFNGLLARRLRGEPVLGGNPRQDRVFRLVGMIEEDWPRARFPEVYESLEAIHRAQVASLAQDRPAATPEPGKLLALSVAKGGSSVLADGYLVAGRLEAAEADFCFGYGAALQLLDDLQDREPDRRAGHATLFSTTPGGPSLDRLAARTHRFLRAVVERADRFSAPVQAEARDLILRNCTLLLVGAVAEQPKAYSTGFRRRLERRWPLGFAAMRRLRRRADRRFRRAAERLRQSRGAASLFDLV